MAVQLNEARLGVLVGKRDYRALREAFGEMNAVDIARFIEDLPEDMTLVIYRTLQKEQAMEVFAELEVETQHRIIEAISENEAGELLDELMVDDAVDMLAELPAKLVPRIIRSSSPETRDMINRFLLYPKNSAGSIMTAEFTDLKAGMTVEDAIKRIRRVGENKETIYTCYVIDSTRRLDGVVTVKDLLLAQDGTLVQDIMETEVISVETTADQEKVAELMARYDFISMPVVDTERRLVGIVTVDDAVGVIQEEATEDFEKMAAMAPSEKPYLKTGVLTMARNRFVWLLVLMVSGMITGAILGRYEAAFAAIPILVTFIPMLTDTGGNAGSQSSTLVIRGMALGEIKTHDVARVIWKELRVSLLVGVPLAAVNFARVVFMTDGNPLEALVVSLAMLCTVMLANSIGGMLPMGAKALKIDPALMAAPLIATIVDALSLIIYFSIAMAFLL